MKRMLTRREMHGLHGAYINQHDGLLSWVGGLEIGQYHLINEWDYRVQSRAMKIIGAWRTESGGAPVDASGVLVNGDQVDGPVALKDALLTRRQLFLRHLTEKMLAYALGRGVEHYDIPAVKQIAECTAKDDHRATTFILEVVKSYPFQWRRGEGAGKEVAGAP